MHHITTSCNGVLKKSPLPIKKDKVKEYNSTVEDCKHHDNKNLFCSYCRRNNYTKEDCFKLKKKKSVSTSASSQVATVKEADYKDNSVAYVSQFTKAINFKNAYLREEIQDNCCNLSALIDTRSPVSFISREVFLEFFVADQLNKVLNPSCNAINSEPINTGGSITCTIKFEILPEFVVSFSWFQKINSFYLFWS